MLLLLLLLLILLYYSSADFRLYVHCSAACKVFKNIGLGIPPYFSHLSILYYLPMTILDYVDRLVQFKFSDKLCLNNLY